MLEAAGDSFANAGSPFPDRCARSAPRRTLRNAIVASSLYSCRARDGLQTTFFGNVNAPFKRGYSASGACHDEGPLILWCPDAAK
jgi:hypothetical protein